MLFDSDGNQTFVSGQIELAGEDLLNPVVEPEPQNLPPISSSFEVSVNDNFWKNGALHEINASDPEGGTVYYTLTEGNRDYDLDGNRTFLLSETGVLSVWDQDDFILQANQEINLNIRLSDSEGNQVSISGQIELGNGLVLNSFPKNLDHNWFGSDWFGDFFSSESEWLYHSQLGWLYVQVDLTNEGFWFWDPYFQGWWWTSPQVFPYYFIFFR